MRRDILELDNPPHIDRVPFTLSVGEAEAIRLVLGGTSVVDWSVLRFSSIERVDQFMHTMCIDMGNPSDRERVRYVYNEAVSYLEETVGLRFPPKLRNPLDIRQVFLTASLGDKTRQQVLSCCALKLMHVIQHMEAADLKFKIAMSEAELFDLAETRILQLGRGLRETGLPIVSFYGSRKSRNSVITKLLAKRDNLATTVFDKLRFRVVVEKNSDLTSVLSYMVDRFFPFNYCIPGESHNNLLRFSDVLQCIAEDERECFQPSSERLEEQACGKNAFSGDKYRMINFIVDFPIHVPPSHSVGFDFELGRVVFVMVEFQLLDEETAAENERGENAHHLYKARQYREVARRLEGSPSSHHDSLQD